MPVNYNLSISTSRPWTFFKLFFKWDGSVWKAIWMQYTAWLVLYTIVSMIYRLALDAEQRRTFAVLVDYLNARLSYVPLNWMLGFFVSAVLARWSYLYKIIGWIDNIALTTSQYVRGSDERARMYRRNIVRHCMLTQVLVFRDLSMRCRKRFPTLDTVQAGGFMAEHERVEFDAIQYNYAKYWLPFQWAWALSYNARKEGLVESDYFQKQISDEIKEFRTGIAWLCNYDWVPLPMIYPTIVCFSVHVYFLVAVVARQYVRESNNFQIDLYFPFMTTFQFILYMGWLKVAEALLNPWGEDDDDFETNMLIDRNLAMGLKIVDEGYGKTPDVAKDDFWDHEWTPMYPEDFDYTTQHQAGTSMANIKLNSSVHEIRMVPLHRRDSSAAMLTRVMSKSKIVPVRPEDQVPQARHRTPSHASLFNLIKPLMEQKAADQEEANGEPRSVPRKTMSVSHLEHPMESGASGWSRLRRFSRSLLHHGEGNHSTVDMKEFKKSGGKDPAHSASDMTSLSKNFSDEKMERKESQILPAVTIREELYGQLSKSGSSGLSLDLMMSRRIDEEDEEKKNWNGNGTETPVADQNEDVEEKEAKKKV